MINRTSIDKTYLYPKDPYKVKYQFLINKDENIYLRMVLKFLLNTQMICKMPTTILNITNQKKNEVLIFFDGIIADIIKNKKLHSMITELFTRCITLNISVVFITQSCFEVPKEVRLNTTYFYYYENSK